MAAHDYEITTLLLPSDEEETDDPKSPSLSPMQAPTNVSFQILTSRNITTLSNNLGEVPPAQIQGFLYVPQLPEEDPCSKQSEQYVPNNVTRFNDIPATTFNAVAFVPWFSMNCSTSYFQQVIYDDAASKALRAILTYQVSDDSTSGLPPPYSNPIWTIDDNSSDWKSQLGLVVYAIPGGTGKEIMQQLGINSGNVSTLPDSSAYFKPFGPGARPRLFADFSVDASPSLPSLWVFLIIVLAILLSIITASSIFMGFIQRRRRTALRRRVERGEVDLEALGIKRMNVPQNELDKMPLYVYQDGSNAKKGGMSPITEQPEAPSGLTADSSTEGPPKTVLKEHYGDGITSAPQGSAEVPPPDGHQFSQTTCAICLDDFVSGSTSVRELPCHHIFHPECVDVFLRDHSSACPVCKKSVLPDGFCPPLITNAMVRREQLIRRLQERRANGVNSTTSPPARRYSRAATHMARRTHIWQSANSRIFNRRAQAQEGQDEPGNAAPTGTELSEIAQAQGANSSRPEPAARNSMLVIQAESNPDRRRELARQRVVTHLNREDAAQDANIEQETQRLPVWRRTVGRVFPGLTA